ncbi:MAG: sigma-70 family RNA polymerase sigma factor [Lachnospiraceae bacterium]|nr:sigma-70 family RNA polymerase sigma factor [Lachnospiraceae bacterium]
MDEDIVKLLRERDQKSIELIAERYERLLRYIAVTILRDRETEVEECINDVYMKVWTHGATFDLEKASFRTWLKAITRNTALNYLRKAVRRETFEESGEEPLGSGDMDESGNPERRMIFQEEVQALGRVLNDLKKKDRELVLRRFYYLQSTRQIAEAMGMSENAVDSKLSRLKKKLRKRYERESRHRISSVVPEDGNRR